jgi:hypothetical protein
MIVKSLSMVVMIYVVLGILSMEVLPQYPECKTPQNPKTRARWAEDDEPLDQLGAILEGEEECS